MLQGAKVVLGVSGSIAAYKAVYLTRLLVESGAEVHPILTQSATRFVGPLSFSALAGRRAVTDMWSAAEQGEVGHVELSHLAQVLVLAPATADLIARLVQGRADEPLTAVALSTKAPWVLAPAMEEGMWENEATQHNVRALVARGARLVSPDSGALASGRSGKGRLAEPEVILEAIAAALSAQDLAGERVVVTAGPTREPLDPARFLSNASTGKMGYALAQVARRRGAEVTLISGPTTLEPPADVRLVRVATTAEMLEACRAALVGATVLVMAAAPADFRPASYSQQKVKKQTGRTTLELEGTPDILSSLAAERRGVISIGFAAESEALLDNARKKLEHKGLDLIVANDITRADAGFAADTNAITLIDRREAVELAVMSKVAAAGRVLDRVVALRRGARG